MTLQSPTIQCPECGTQIPLSETIAAPLVAQAKAEAEGRVRTLLDEKLAAERALATERQNIALEKESIEKEVAKRLSEQLQEGEKVQREKIRSEFESQLQGSAAREAEVRTILQKNQSELAEVLKQKQAAELAAQAAQMEAQRAAQAEIAKLRDEAQREAQEAERLRIAEKDKQIEKLVSQLDEARRQAIQGSQQMQGEVLELDLEDLLRKAFPWDEIEAVKSGQRGGDLVQKVMLAPGLSAGTLMWEIKRTVAWGGEWTTKAKQDAILVKAEIVIIVSEVLPRGVENFALYEGVWVCRPQFVMPLATAMRQQMEQVYTARRLAEGKQGKAELLYDYLTGSEFKARIEGIIEPFVAMQTDLAKEKAATLKRWKKREKQIERVLLSVTGLSGDLQGIGGREMPELPALEDYEDTEDDEG
ncbi:MAG: DUF2130 domain-containing protein [Fimbriimonadaceae bacterium]|jgi:hypothetical protein|nr:DUF2130 domain-containing protein [Fimbriimonadaceae bacterium]